MQHPSLKYIWRQRWIDWIFFIPLCGLIILAMKYLLRYRVNEMKALRSYYQELTNDPSKPLLICANHLTYIDSIVLIYAFGNHWWYFFNFRRLSWNLPAANYQKNLFFRVVGYFSKCVFIDREGSKQHKDLVLNQARLILLQGEPVTIFPEGRRSQSGRFDNRKLAFGIGKILAEMDSCRVLCVYVRSHLQREKSKLPAAHSRFTLLTELKLYRRENYPEKTSFSVTTEIAATIQSLEAKYFADRLT